MLNNEHERVLMVIDFLRWRIHRVAQIRHDHIDARSQSFCLAGAQFMRQMVNIWIAERLVQQHVGRQGAGARHRDIREIPESFQMILPLCQIIGYISFCLIDKPIADRVQHRLGFAHSIDDVFRRLFMPKMHLRKVG